MSIAVTTMIRNQYNPFNDPLFFFMGLQFLATKPFKFVFKKTAELIRLWKENKYNLLRPEQVVKLFTDSSKSPSFAALAITQVSEKDISIKNILNLA